MSGPGHGKICKTFFESTKNRASDKWRRKRRKLNFPNSIFISILNKFAVKSFGEVGKAQTSGPVSGLVPENSDDSMLSTLVVFINKKWNIFYGNWGEKLITKDYRHYVSQRRRSLVVAWRKTTRLLSATEESLWKMWESLEQRKKKRKKCT